MLALFFRPIGATVDLENPEKMSIWSLSELSIQPRTSLSKFEGDFISFCIRLLTNYLRQYRSVQVAVGIRPGTAIGARPKAWGHSAG